MASTARYLVTGLAVTIALGSTGQAIADQDGQVTIVIHVDNYARIPARERLWAEAEVTRIYARAGVRTSWPTGEDQADAPGLHVRVQLLSGDMAMRKIRAERLADTVFGEAARGAGIAYIFIHRIASMAVRHRGDFRRILGLVMAHEVGHLVLPSYGHADRGIMRADIGGRSRGDYDFTNEQGAAIRSMLLTVSRPQE